MKPIRALALFIGLSMSGAMAAAAAPANGVITPADCQFTLPGATLRCGRIQLPGDHSAPDQGPTISMFYVRVSARDPASTGEPIVLLSGGPGMAGSQTLQEGAALYAGLQAHHDLIFIDQRGTGRSTPSLVCPNVGARAVLYQQLTIAEVRKCRAPLVEAGYRTAWFDTAQSAADVIALRRALGIERWNVMGTSYGTVLAQEVLRRDAAATRAVVLNSPTLPDASEADTATVLGVAAAWNAIFLDCAAAPACAGPLPGARDRYLRLVGQLRDHPLKAQWKDIHGRSLLGAMNANAMQQVTNTLAGTGQGSAMALSALNYLERIANGELPNDPTMVGAMYVPASFQQVAKTSALGLNLSVTCREVMPRTNVRLLRAKAESARPFVVPEVLMKAYETACPEWGAGRADALLYRPVTADVPVLLLTGNYDMAAPGHLAQTIAASLPRAQLVRFDGIGHGVFEAEPCARALVADFLREGRVDVTTACVPATPAVNFKLWTP